MTTESEMGSISKGRPENIFTLMGSLGIEYCIIQNGKSQILVYE